MQQTAPRQPSPIDGKEQNCDSFGTYEPALATTQTRNLCHGGWYRAAWYEPCPVRDECREHTSAAKRALPVLNNPATRIPPSPAAAQTERFLRLPTFRSMSSAPTQHPQARAAQDVRAQVHATAQEAQAQIPPAVTPSKDAPPGMRTPFVGVADSSASPTYIPAEGQSTIERLLLNILQAIIAAIGYQVWVFARSIDFFSRT